MRSNTSIGVYATADTDTDMSTPCTGVPATYIIRPGRSLGERTQWVAHSSAVTVSICEFAVGFGQFLRKNRVSQIKSNQIELFYSAPKS